MLGDWYKSRIDLIKDMHQLSEQIATMRCLGRAHWNKDDYELAYAIKNGHITVPKGSLWNPKSYLKPEDEQANIRRGLFNVRRWHNINDGANRLRKENDPFPDLPYAAPTGFNDSVFARPSHIKNLQDDAMGAAYPM